MTRLFKGALLLMATVLLLSACSGNAKEEQKATNDKVVKMFNSTPKKANNKNKDIRFYLPFGFEIKEKSANNILLKNGSKKYILFYNPNETTVSKVVYNATIGINEKFEYKKTYKKMINLGFC